MADKLVETDVEKAKGTVGGSVRRKLTLRSGGRVFTMPGGKKLVVAAGRDKMGVHRWAWNIRKSADPVATLYAEIEKARGLFPKGAGSAGAAKRLTRFARRESRVAGSNLAGHRRLHLAERRMDKIMAPSGRKGAGDRFSAAQKYLAGRAKRK